MNRFRRNQKADRPRSSSDALQSGSASPENPPQSGLANFTSVEWICLFSFASYLGIPERDWITECLVKISVLPQDLQHVS